MKYVLPFSLALALGCGTAPEPSPTPAAPTPTAATPAAPTPPAPAPAAASPVAEVSAAPLEEVDLLHAVPARITVSSAYHDDASQISRIADGDLTTAWNSRTGDLVGSWIELALPAEASVRAIAMTVGFTRTTARSDLFTGNHRVSRVRVSRDGAVLGEHDLDTSAQTLVEIPVNGPGGALRIEVLATVAGTHDDWREVCVSEIRALGTAVGASAGSLVPTTSIGQTILGDEGNTAIVAVPGSEPIAVPLGDDVEQDAADAREDAEDVRRLCELLMDEWDDYTVHVRRPSGLASRREQEEDERQAALVRRRALFEHAAELFAPAEASDARRRAGQDASPSGSRRGDFEALIHGCDAVLAQSPTEACAWAERRALARLRELGWYAFDATLDLETVVELRETEDGRPLRGDALQAERDALAIATAFNRWLDPYVDDWDDLHHRHREVLLGEVPPPGRLESEWAQLRADVRRAEEACAAH